MIMRQCQETEKNTVGKEKNAFVALWLFYLGQVAKSHLALCTSKCEWLLLEGELGTS